MNESECGGHCDELLTEGTILIGLGGTESVFIGSCQVKQPNGVPHNEYPHHHSEICNCSSRCRFNDSNSQIIDDLEKCSTVMFR